MPYLSVKPEDGRRVRVDIGHHSLVSDLPAEWGGHDSGPTPTELFVAALASCATQYALAYLDRQHLDLKGLEVGCHYDLGERPERVEAVHLSVRVPYELTVEQQEGLTNAIQRCSVHASIAVPAQLRVVVAQARPPAGVAGS